MDNSKEITSKESSISFILDNFLNNMKEIKIFFDSNLPLVKNRESEVRDKIKKFMSVHIEEKNGEKMILVPVEESKLFQKLLEEGRYSFHQPLLCNSCFLILINNFEYIIKAILRKLFLSYPKSILDKKDFIIEFEELCQFKEITEVKEFMINRYLEKIFYKSFSDQQKILLKLFNNPEIFSLINFPLLEEATKERNLLAHNNGVITESFAKQTGRPLDSIGKKIFVSQDEFEKIYQEILFFGFCFLVLLGDKIKDKEFLDKEYQHLLFTLLERKNFVLLKRLYEATSSFAVSDDGTSEVVNLVNYLLALKNIPEENAKFSKLLKEYKTGQLSDHFKCAFSILKQDKKGFIKYLSKSEFTLQDWYEFPIFDIVKEDDKLSKKALPVLKKNTKRISKNAKK